MIAVDTLLLMSSSSNLSDQSLQYCAIAKRHMGGPNENRCRDVHGAGGALRSLIFWWPTGEYNRGFLLIFLRTWVAASLFTQDHKLVWWW
jgi:hypothetical protein